MIKFITNEANDAPVHQRLAEQLNACAPGKTFKVPEGLGEGFLWTETVPFGIMVLVSEARMNDSLSFTYEVSPTYHFCLQFNDAQYDILNKKKDSHSRNTPSVQTSVKICDTSGVLTLAWPAGTTIRTVKLFFNKEHLLLLLGKPEVEHVLSRYLDQLKTAENPEPIDTAYRIMLNDLLLENISHPLRFNYIQNRILLLLEKFILKFEGKKDLLFTRLKNSGDEMDRLMRVEALLVKDFSVSPPTILELSRLSAMSATKLKTDFKSLYGLPIYEYYQKNRMLKAKELLTLEQYSIKEVGMMVGYSNLSHFASTFKKEFGILPSELSAKDGMVVYNI